MNRKADCLSTAALLDSTTPVAIAGAAELAAATIGCLLTHGSWILFASALLGMLHCWYSVRVRFDAGLFRLLADAAESSDIDDYLARTGLRAKTAPRTLDERVAGAVRLWQRQLTCFALQTACLLGGIALHLCSKA